MKNKPIKGSRLAGLLLTACGLALIATTANAAMPAGKVARAPAPSCDRECLRSHVTQLLWALVKHDVSKLPVADNVRVTEDADVKELKNVGLVRSVTALQGFRQDFIDERMGVVGAHTMVEESGAPIMLVVRLKVADNKLTEIELVSTRSRAEGLIFNLGGLKAASEGMNYAPRADELATREQVLAAALKYPEGFIKAETFAAVNAPFTPDAYRLENGQMMAGPDCKFSPDCKNISTQSLAIFKRLGPPIWRVVAIDERMGIAWLRLAWGVRQEGGDQLTAFEAFKFYGGQLHAVEAFIRILPIEKRKGGWETGVAPSGP